MRYTQHISKDLWMMDANGDNPRKWTKPDPEKDPRNHYYPRWSSDGKKILCCESYVNFEAVEVEDGVIFKMWTKGQFLYIIHNIQDDGTQILDIPENWFCSSLSWMNDQQLVLFSAYEYKKERFAKPAYNIYKYDLLSNQFTHLTEGRGADWHEGPLSVSPVGKKSVRWSELKKAYTGK